MPPDRQHRAGDRRAPCRGRTAARRVRRWLHRRRARRSPRSPRSRAGCTTSGIAAHWRDELLAVVDDGGRVRRRRSSAPRSASSALRPTAVHLVGYADGDAVWVQQRARDKSTDPGLWDTLMGGQVAAGESIADDAGARDDGGGRARARRPARARARRTGAAPQAGARGLHGRADRGLSSPSSLPARRRRTATARSSVSSASPSPRCASDFAAGAFTLEASLILGAELERRNEAGLA